jgi:hypothetical protein
VIGHRNGVARVRARRRRTRMARIEGSTPIFFGFIRSIRVIRVLFNPHTDVKTALDTDVKTALDTDVKTALDEDIGL